MTIADAPSNKSTLLVQFAGGFLSVPVNIIRKTICNNIKEGYLTYFYSSSQFFFGLHITRVARIII